MDYIACQVPLSKGFPRQEYWSGLPCLPPGDLPSPGIEPMSLTSPALTGRFFATSTTWDAPAPKSRFPRIYYRAISFFTFIPPAQAPERPRYAFVFYRHWPFLQEGWGETFCFLRLPTPQFQSSFVTELGVSFWQSCSSLPFSSPSTIDLKRSGSSNAILQRE